MLTSQSHTYLGFDLRNIKRQKKLNRINKRRKVLLLTIEFVKKKQLKLDWAFSPLRYRKQLESSRVRLIIVFKNYCLKRCENCSLKTVVKKCVFV